MKRTLYFVCILEKFNNKKYLFESSKKKVLIDHNLVLLPFHIKNIFYQSNIKVFYDTFENR